MTKTIPPTSAVDDSGVRHALADQRAVGQDVHELYQRTLADLTELAALVGRFSSGGPRVVEETRRYARAVVEATPPAPPEPAPPIYGRAGQPWPQPPADTPPSPHPPAVLPNGMQYQGDLRAGVVYANGAAAVDAAGNRHVGYDRQLPARVGRRLLAEALHSAGQHQPIDGVAPVPVDWADQVGRL